MAGYRREPHSGQPAAPVQRRGLLAAVAALAATVLGKTTATPAQAGTDGDLVLGVQNQLVSGVNNHQTTLTAAATSFPDLALLRVSAQPDTSSGTVAIEALGSGASRGGAERLQV